jgi:HK97 family phage major capsid protein
MITMDQLIESARRELETHSDTVRALDDELLAMRDDLDAGRRQITREEVRAVARKRDQARREQQYAQEKLERYMNEKNEDDRVAALRSQTVPTGARTRSYDQVARVTGEPSTYTAHSERTGGHSFLRDLFAAQIKNDSQAHERLARHGREVEANQKRAVVTGDVASFVPPAYLTDTFAEFARAGRPLANLLTTQPLPPVGMSLTVPKITTGSTVDVQATQATGIDNTDPADTGIEVDITTVGGFVEVSRQTLERGVIVEDIIFNDLAADYAAKLDALAITAALAQSGVNTITYTASSPTVVELWPKLADAAGRVRSQRFTGPTAFVMHPSRWAVLQAAVSTSDERPLLGGIASGPVNVMGVETNTQYGAAVGTLLGTPVVLDANLPTDLGTGTNEDVILVADWRDSMLFEDSPVPTQLKFEANGGTTLSVNLVAYGYSAVTFARQPQSLSKITGTGLAAVTL